MPTESRTEQLLNAYINGDDISNFVPLSRNEQILKDMILGNEQTSSPQSRIESLYKKLDEKIRTSSSVSDFFIKKGTNLKYLFYRYPNKTIPDDLLTKDFLNNFTDLSYLFCSSKIETIPKIDISKVTDTSYMFCNCTNLSSIPELDTSNVINMSHMFCGEYGYPMSKLITIPNIDTSNVTDMSYMFSQCTSLTSIPELNTSNVTDTSYMFSQCTSLTSIPELNTSNVEKNSGMFYMCNNLEYIPALDFSKASVFNQTFGHCKKLKSIELFNSDKTNYLRSTFSYCYELKKVIVNYYPYVTYESDVDYLFSDCYSLKTVIIKNIEDRAKLGGSSFSNCYHFLGTSNSTYNPDGLKDGRIYIPIDYVEKISILDNWKRFSDIIKPLELIENNISPIYIVDDDKVKNEIAQGIIYLDNYNNIPEVSISSSNENILTIGDVEVSTNKIIFNINTVNSGIATITSNITGDNSDIKTINFKVKTPIVNYSVEPSPKSIYGFELNENGYYEDIVKVTNGNGCNSECLLRFTITDNSLKGIRILCIHNSSRWTESAWIGKIDMMDWKNSSDCQYIFDADAGKGIIEKEIVYPKTTIGEHFIRIRYQHSGMGKTTDGLQFKIIPQFD